MSDQIKITLPAKTGAPVHRSDLPEQARHEWQTPEERKAAKKGLLACNDEIEAPL